MKYPEVVRPNHRYRGPMESRKDNDAVRDIAHSIDILKKQFEQNKAKSIGIKETMYEVYNEDIPNKRKALVHKVKTVRGGEL